VFRTTWLFVMKDKQDALFVYHKRKSCLHKAFKTYLLAIPATRKVCVCAFVYLKKRIQCQSHATSNCLLTICNCAQHFHSFVVVQGGQTWNGGEQSLNGDPGTTGPPLSTAMRKSINRELWQTATLGYLMRSKLCAIYYLKISIWV